MGIFDTLSAILAANIYSGKVMNTESAMTEGARDLVSARGFKANAKSIKCIVEGAQKYLSR